MQNIFDFGTAYPLTWTHWILVFLAALIQGLGKAGLKGLSPIIVTIMALVFGSKASTGVLVPLMVAADILAVIYYHRYTQWKYLLKLLPSMVIGVVIAGYIGHTISEPLFKKLMAILILSTVVVMIYMDRKKNQEIPSHWLFSGGMGLVAGFTSMIGNLAGAFANIYLLAIRLPKNEFIGTAAWLFFLVNVLKLQFHIFVWETVTVKSLFLDLYLVPGLLLGFLLGVKIVKLIKNDFYRKLVLIVTAIGAFMILFNNPI
ncbi:sulfite exporter TauE/SafE family protein [Flavicella sediminum]|uniref:sulfite exporter TauE/SafE family protein n=1 Tax=Flavicella sediminum TaxID=2585141 RepID=UPI00111D2D84|nr:sulfite exporter TauE/SafE family protein [Flavicella sediminum]